jgi:glycosyltransferase involved in cell wall biosynthesis
MNILVLSWRDPNHPMSGGAEQVMHEHMKGWVDNGHSVTLFASSFKGTNEETLDGVHIVRQGRQILGVHIKACLWYLFGKHETFDVVVDQFHGIPFFTPLYCRAKKLAVVQEVARNVWMKNHLPKPFNYIFGAIGFVTEPLYYLFYKNVSFMTGSESAKKDLISIGISANNITIVPHGVKLSVPKPLPKKEKVKTVVFLGAIAKDKGIEDALKTFSLLSKNGSYHYWVIGKAGELYLKEVLDITQRLGISKIVTFWGFVTEQKKFELLAKAHVMINPSAHEGWGLVNIEANSVGTPVVAYPSAGLVDSVKDNVSGVIIKHSTPESMAEAVEAVLENKEAYSKLQKGALSWSKNFTWPSSKKQSLRLIESL